MSLRPWEIGDHQQRWNGYYNLQCWDQDQGDLVLANKLNALTYVDLRYAEDSYVAAGAAELHELGLPASYDLAGLQSIHAHLFGEVYEWAGELRTVGMDKGGVPFASTSQIPELLAAVAAKIEQTDRLAAVPEEKLPESLARIYHVVNTAHPFREGNGRTQREFVSALARETDHEIVWNRVTGRRNDQASHAARATNDLGPLISCFADAVQRRQPAVDRQVEGAVYRASMPEPVGEVLGTRSGQRPTQPGERGTRGPERGR